MGKPLAEGIPVSIPEVEALQRKVEAQAAELEKQGHQTTELESLLAFESAERAELVKRNQACLFGISSGAGLREEDNTFAYCEAPGDVEDVDVRWEVLPQVRLKPFAKGKGAKGGATGKPVVDEGAWAAVEEGQGLTGASAKRAEAVARSLAAVALARRAQGGLCPLLTGAPAAGLQAARRDHQLTAAGLQGRSRPAQRTCLEDVLYFLENRRRRCQPRSLWLLGRLVGALIPSRSSSSGAWLADSTASTRCKTRVPSTCSSQQPRPTRPHSSAGSTGGYRWEDCLLCSTSATDGPSCELRAAISLGGAQITYYSQKQITTAKLITTAKTNTPIQHAPTTGNIN